MKSLNSIIMTMLFVFGLQTILTAPSLAQSLKVQQLVEEDLAKKTKYTGTLDIYDEAQDTVRHFKFVEYLDEPQEQDSQWIQAARFRDTKSGEIIVLNAVVNKEDKGKYAVGSWQILKDPQSSAPAEQSPGKENYTDQEVQDFLKGYIQERSKFTGTFDLFDEKTQKIRKLIMGEYNPQVRRYGVLAISSIDATDTESSQKVVLDATVENQSGQLAVKSIRIKQ